MISVVRGQSEREGKSLQLGLDHAIQARVEDVLERTVTRWRAKSASALVLDPRNGAIIAMGVAPGFDANKFPEVPAALTRNRLVTDTYEPGSTFKVVTVAASLSERIVTPRTTFTLASSIRVADRTIGEAHPRPTQRFMVAEILARSSNVGTIRLAQKLGPRRLAKWIRRFGFGRRTGIDYAGETPGIVIPVEQWSGSTIGNVPLGQGIAVTPIQMAAAYATIANRGVWVEPHLVERIGGGKHQPPKRRRVFSKVVATQLAEMLRGVVDEGGTGTAADVKGYSVAGKTGTAAKPDRTGYSDSRYVASFVGFVPASAPRLVILVTVDEPRRSIWGGVVAAPAFGEIAEFALTHLEVPPDNRRGAQARKE